jgi:UDP-N-acetylmuramoyl-tripeptide--D-alanyl-D-alanine ligase
LSQRVRREFSRSRRIISFGHAEHADVRAVKIECLRPFGYQFALVMDGGISQTVELRVFGKHNISNALAAAAIARFFGVEPAHIARQLSAFRPAGNRSEVEEIDGWHIIKDYYNASPYAVEMALNSLSDFDIPGRRFAVLADMMELGDLEEVYHRRVGELAAHAGLEWLFTVGERGRMIALAAAARGAKAEHLPDTGAVVERLQQMLRPGDLLLIKGSRLMRLERIYDLLKGRTHSS